MGGWLSTGASRVSSSVCHTRLTPVQLSLAEGRILGAAPRRAGGGRQRICGFGGLHHGEGEGGGRLRTCGSWGLH